ncbi:uncharacterized protein CBL_11098 [Carabus blaptoides fortunei]
MRQSVISLEKPTPHVSLSDWHSRLRELQQTAQTRRDDAHGLRHNCRQLRNETNIRTQWDTYHNNARLADRVTEVNRWRETLLACRDRLDREFGLLKEEKTETERELDALGIFISVVSECIGMRDSRLGSEITYDDGDTELKKELCVLEDVKKMLMDRCQASWEKLNRLQEVRFKLTLEIDNKEESVAIDKDQLTLDKNCANISFKLDALRIPKNSVPYETWLEHSRYMKILADNELADTYKLREALFVCREKARNDMSAQRDSTDFTLRKRIYETQKSRNELQWQQLKMREEMDKLKKEIQTLEDSVQSKTDAQKLAETRLENRYMRTGPENCMDEPEIGLKNEVLQLRQTIQDIRDQINCAKTTYNALEEQQVRIDRDLDNKRHSLMTDVRCLDLRIRLRTDPASQTDRNIKLTRMEEEIPPT